MSPLPHLETTATLQVMNGWRPLSSAATTTASTATTTTKGAGIIEVKPRGRPLLCLSDIHGDLQALEAVLASVKHLNLCGIVVCGDHVVGGPEPFEVWSRLVSLGAHMTRGPTDVALGAVDKLAHELTPSSASEEARLLTFIRARKALGDVVCRRLAELPSTLVVSLDDTTGVMVLHGSPADDCDGLYDNNNLADHVASVAEDVLVTGATRKPFARRIDRPLDAIILDDDGEQPPAFMLTPRPLLVVNAGTVGMNPVRTADERRTAFAVLLSCAHDDRVHAWGHDVPVGRAARSRAG